MKNEENKSASRFWLMSGVTMMSIFLAACAAEGPEKETRAPSSKAGETQSVQLDPVKVSMGERVYKDNCSSCHGHDLHGGAGFNLVDSEWVHGDSLDQIKQSVSKGFLEAGMPGFGEMLDAEQIENVATFIQSKQEGWESVDYKVYAVEKGALPDFKALETAEPISSGNLPNGLADFSMPEIENYAISFEGDFYAPWAEDTSLSFEAARFFYSDIKTTGMQLEIDGEIQPRTGTDKWSALYPIKKGKQRIKISYFISDLEQKPGVWHLKGARIFVVRSDRSAKLAPLTVTAKQSLENAVHNLIAEEVPLVIRSKTVDLPTYSITVGLLNKVNYAFNNRTCSIVGVWKGDALNVGPNIQGRGQEASMPLGEWAFHYPKNIGFEEKSDEGKCKLTKYTRGDVPAFYYQKDGVSYKLSGEEVDEGVRFNYEVLSDGSFPTTISVPEMKLYKASSDLPNAGDDALMFNTDGQSKFSILLELNDGE